MADPYPHCSVCHKPIGDPEYGEEEGYEVTFADHAEPEEHEWVKAYKGIKWFCDAHYPAARALSHLTSEEALRQLEEQLGTFPPLPVILEESSRWRKLNDALSNGPYNPAPYPCVLCHREEHWHSRVAYFPGPYFIRIVNLTGIVEFADSKELHFCNKHALLAYSLSHLSAEEALRQMREEFGPFPDPPVLSPWDRFYARVHRGDFVLPGKVQRLKLIREALFGKRPPPGLRCDLCYEEGIPEENYVKFADCELPADSKVLPYRYFGLKRFCNEHLPAARALSHLTAQKAMTQLRRRFGNFTRVVVRPRR
jgi:hypothetical protein